MKVVDNVISIFRNKAEPVVIAPKEEEIVSWKETPEDIISWMTEEEKAIETQAMIDVLTILSCESNPAHHLEDLEKAIGALKKVKDNFLFFSFNQNGRR